MLGDAALSFFIRVLSFLRMCAFMFEGAALCFVCCFCGCLCSSVLPETMPLLSGQARRPFASEWLSGPNHMRILAFDGNGERYSAECDLQNQKMGVSYDVDQKEARFIMPALDFCKNMFLEGFCLRRSCAHAHIRSAHFGVQDVDRTIYRPRRFYSDAFCVFLTLTCRPLWRASTRRSGGCQWRPLEQLLPFRGVPWVGSAWRVLDDKSFEKEMKKKHTSTVFVVVADAGVLQGELFGWAHRKFDLWLQEKTLWHCKVRGAMTDMLKVYPFSESGWRGCLNNCPEAEPCSEISENFAKKWLGDCDVAVVLFTGNGEKYSARYDVRVQRVIQSFQFGAEGVTKRFYVLDFLRCQFCLGCVLKPGANHPKQKFFGAKELGLYERRCFTSEVLSDFFVNLCAQEGEGLSEELLQSGWQPLPLGCVSESLSGKVFRWCVSCQKFFDGAVVKDPPAPAFFVIVKGVGFLVGDLMSPLDIPPPFPLRRCLWWPVLGEDVPYL